MADLQVFLFGKFEIRQNSQSVTDLKSRKVQELFAYLLLYQGQQHHRESLANLIWEDANPTQSRNYLRKAIWQLQLALDEITDGLSDELLEITDEWVKINPKAQIQVDVAEFEAAFAHSRDIPGQKMDATALQAIEKAISLYRGNLLDGWYRDWCLFERERMQQIYLHLLDKLMDCCEAHQEWERGLMYGALVLRCDIARERTHRRLMRLHYLARDRTAALRQFERCKESLQKELGVEPSRLTMKLYHQICKDPITTPRREALDVISGEASEQSLPGMLIQLEELNRTLSQVQNQVDYQIRKLEAFLSDPR